jgi:hypothetical protein
VAISGAGAPTRTGNKLLLALSVDLSIRKEVKEMRMPQINAEASLYRTGERYASRAGWAGATGEAAVVPQQACGGCVGPCIPFIRRCLRICSC